MQHFKLAGNIPNDSVLIHVFLSCSSIYNLKNIIGKYSNSKLAFFSRCRNVGKFNNAIFKAVSVEVNDKNLGLNL